MNGKYILLCACTPSVLVPKGSINHGGRKMLVKGQGEGREQQVSAEGSASVFIIKTAVTLYLRTLLMRTCLQVQANLTWANSQQVKLLL